MDITNNSAFISCSPIYTYGTKESPVKIFSSDKTANGITVLQAAKKSVFKFTNFEKLNTLDYKGWQLTGALNFYESDVEFYNCSFVRNFCEDMLNTIRCNFYLENCLFKNTFGDAHDSDFCAGKLKSCKFENIGNDAIDFSSSNVLIESCIIKQTGDKGISVGEKTKAKILASFISNTNIAIASKDLSEAEINNCKIQIMVF